MLCILRGILAVLENHSCQVMQRGIYIFSMQILHGCCTVLSTWSSSVLHLYSIFGEVRSSHGFSYHFYEDNTQHPLLPSLIHSSFPLRSQDIWQTLHHVQLLISGNSSLAKLICYQADSPPHQDLVISLDKSLISPSVTACNLEVTMDNQLSFSSHVANLTRSCRFLLYNIRRICPCLSGHLFIPLSIRDWTTATHSWQVFL